MKARGLKIDLPHPTAGSVPSVANPIKYASTPLAFELAPPELGAHTRMVLHEELGLSLEEIDRLREARII